MTTELIMTVASRFLAFALLLTGAVTAAESATVYRWVDAAGQVHFSQVPPTSGGYDMIQGGRSTPSPAATPAPGAAESGKAALTPEQRFLQEAEATRKAKADEKEKARKAKAEAELKCTEARQRATFLEERTARRLATIAEDGNYTRMPEDEFMKRLDAAKQDVATHCR